MLPETHIAHMILKIFSFAGRNHHHFYGILPLCFVVVGKSVGSGVLRCVRISPFSVAWTILQ
jgi:hypothetical protein